MATYKIVDKEYNEVIGRFSTNRSFTFDEAMAIAGFKWFDAEEAGYGDCDGWSDDEGMTVWNDEVAEIERDE